MPTYTAGSTRVALEQPDLTTFQANGSVVLDSRRVRPYWFDGRFLNAPALEREQNYFLLREADLAQASGFQTITGLMVDQTDANGNFVGSGSFVIHAGEGVTPAGEMVSVRSDLTVSMASLTEQPSLDAQLGLTVAPAASTKNRSGLYAIALQPMEHNADPISSYPTTVQGPRTTHDSDIVEDTVVSLVPYPNPAASFAASLQQAALARQIFVTGSASALSDSLLPLALVSVQQGAISWIDPYLVRRDSGQQYSGVQFGLSDPVAQEAYLLQYDMQLQSIVASRQANGLKANFAASDFLQSIPSVGRFPMDAIDTSSFSQVFFPQEMDVRLSIVPSDELPALLQDALSLPPIDLTLQSSTYSNMAVLALIPVPRANFASLKNSLPDTPLNPTLPQVLANRSPLQLLRLYQGAVNLTAVPAVSNNVWATAIGSQQYGFYLRRPSDPTMVKFTAPTGVVISSSVNPSAFGQAVTFTAALSPASASGTVEFLDGASVLGNGAVASGVADLTVANLAVGSHPITGSYQGDASDAAGTSAVLTQVVNKATATVTVTSSVNPSTIGQAVTLTAKLTPTTATGTVQFFDGGTSLGNSALNVGSASFATSTLTLGAHKITAVYSGDDDTAAATSAVFTQTVDKVVSSTTLASSANPSTAGEAVTFTAKITPDTATGTVNFMDGTTALGTGSVENGAATLSISTLTAGTHPITATYSGDANNAASTSGILTQTVNRAQSSVTLTSSLNPSTLGQAVTFTAKLTPAAATGSVQFLDGGTALGTATVASGAASLPVSTLPVGTHTMTAVYSGDVSNAPATSAALTQTVNKSPSAVTVSSSANPSTFGQAVTFRAAVTPASATGSVQFLDGVTVLGTEALSGGTAALTDSTLTVGPHSITAVYSGDGNDAAATSAVLTQTVNKSGSAVALTSSQNPSTVGQAVTFTAQVTPATATGTLQFLDGAALMASETLSGGKASATVSNLPVGTLSITADYQGDGDTASASAVLTQTVNKAATSVALRSSVNPSTPGESVTFTATVTPASATGTVEFMDVGGSLGTETLNGGTATLTVTALAVGSDSITAVYSGDANDNGSTSAPLIQTVNKAATSVALTSSLNPSTLGQAVTFAAKVTPATATGTVQFLHGAAAIGTGTLINGAATVTDATLPVGAQTMTAVYSGDATNAGSTSPALTQTVNKAATTVVVSSSANPSAIGQTVTFTAKTSPASATGTVQFFDNGQSLGTETLNGGAGALSDSSLAAGAHSVTASYSGDANNAASTSPALSQTVNKAAVTLTLTANPTTITVGNPITFTATLTPNSATGTVAFADETATLGSADIKNGQAQLQVQLSATGAPILTVGNHTITATYPGNATLGAASGKTAITVNQVVIQ